MTQQQMTLPDKLLAGPKRFRRQAETWIAQQPPYVEVAVATMLGGGQGAFLGTIMGTMTKLDPNAGKFPFSPPAGANPEVAQRMSAIQSGGPMAQARNFAVMTGVNAGLSLAVKRYRGGVEDVRGVMIAGFGSGAAFSLVSGMTQGNPLMGAFSTGTLFALLQGAFYQVGKKFQQPAGTTPKQYERAQFMLDRLGLSNYQKNLKKALLTDNTIMLWNDNALQEARIPPGPRLQILHHLEQYKHILKPGMPAPNQLPLPPQEVHND